jgi:hypothetical protein
VEPAPASPVEVASSPPERGVDTEPGALGPAPHRGHRRLLIGGIVGLGALVALVVVALVVGGGGGSTTTQVVVKRTAPKPKPAPTVPVSWVVARQLIQHCQVKHLELTHSRLVTLRLRSGRVVFAHEPKTDDIFRILNRLPRTCWPKTVAEE